MSEQREGHGTECSCKTCREIRRYDAHMAICEAEARRFAKPAQPEEAGK